MTMLDISRRWTLFTTAVIAWTAMPVAAQSPAPAGGVPTALRERKLSAVEIDPAPLGMAECPSAGGLDARTVVAVCRSRSVGGAAGALHLVLVDRSEGHERIAYRGPSAGDAYYIRPTIFDGEGDGPTVILAESGAEFSYGIDVYVTGPGLKVRRAGQIELGAPGEDGPTSAVPFVHLERRGKDLCFTFTHDLVRLRPDGSYAQVPKASAGYLYRNGKLLRSRCPADGR
jgi:hypothetical protein